MACAGYLVLNNTSLVHAEVVQGLLVCTPAKHHRRAQEQQHDDNEAQPEEECQCGDSASNASSLPLLALKRMITSDSVAPPKLKLQQDDSIHDNNDYSCAQQQRVMALSGHVVDVTDCNIAARADDATSAMKFSFHVTTNKVVLHSDGRCTKIPIDSIVLAAATQSAKEEWMARLTHWNRYGWRDTTLIAGTAHDVATLEANMARWRERESHEAKNVARPEPPTPLRSTRRRFYRATGSVIFPREEANANDAWFQVRVVNTHS